MNIPIGDTHKLTSDSLNIILREKKVVQEGKTKGTVSWDVVGYFGCVEHALNKLLDIKVKDSTATDLKQLISDIETYRREISCIFEGV